VVATGGAGPAELCSRGSPVGDAGAPCEGEARPGVRRGSRATQRYDCRRWWSQHCHREAFRGRIEAWFGEGLYFWAPDLCCVPRPSAGFSTTKAPRSGGAPLARKPAAVLLIPFERLVSIVLWQLGATAWSMRPPPLFAAQPGPYTESGNWLTPLGQWRCASATTSRRWLFWLMALSMPAWPRETVESLGTWAHGCLLAWLDRGDG